MVAGLRGLVVRRREQPRAERDGAAVGPGGLVGRLVQGVREVVGAHVVGAAIENAFYMSALYIGAPGVPREGAGPAGHIGNALIYNALV